MFNYEDFQHSNIQESTMALSPTRRTNEDGYTSDSSTVNGSTSGEQSGAENAPGSFEGPEKTMEVVFAPNKGAPKGLRGLPRNQVDYLCAKAKCEILTKSSNAHIDAYVLSESSLFIYENRFIMKTCGTTTLLRCLSALLEFADKLGMVLSWVGYSRKNFLFPDAQLWPHANFGEEMKYLSTHKKLQRRLGGSGYILGPITGDHWYVYVAENIQLSQYLTANTTASCQEDDNTMDDTEVNYGDDGEEKAVTDECESFLSCSNRPSPAAGVALPPNFPHRVRGQKHHHLHYRTLNMMMFDMSPRVAETFFQEKNGLTGPEMTKAAGIAGLCPGAKIDEAAFLPCGYSMNAILHDAYTTIHITPESECSYVSFETNTRLHSYCALVRHVLSIFQPKRFVLTMFGDQSFMDSLRTVPTDVRFINLPGLGGYMRSTVSSTRIEQQRQSCVMSCYAFEPLEQRKEIHTSMPRAQAACTMTTPSEVVLLRGQPSTVNAMGVMGSGSLLTPPFSLSERKERAYSLY